MGVVRNHSGRQFVRFVPPILLIVLGLTLFTTAGRDDAFITYWPAYSLSEYGQLVNYNGEPIEQSSSLFQVIALALLHSVTGIQVELIGSALTILAGAASVLATYQLARKFDRGNAGFAALLLSTSAFFVYWSFGGLETTLMSLTSLLLILTFGEYLAASGRVTIRQILQSIAVTLMFLLIRPETSIVLFCVLFGVLLVLGSRRILPGIKLTSDARHVASRVVALAVIAIASYAAIVLFRITYFGNAVPQTVSAKTGASLHEEAKIGIDYLAYNFLGIPDLFEWLKNPDFSFVQVALLNVPLLFVALVGVGSNITEQLQAEAIDSYGLLSLLFAASYFAFIVFSGGDWMEGGRFIAHVLPVFLIFASIGITTVFRSERWRRLAMVALVILQIGFMIQFAQQESTGVPIWSAIKHYRELGAEFQADKFDWFERTNRVHLRDIPLSYQLNRVTRQIADHKGSKVVVMSGQMGMVSYHLTKEFYGEVYLLDRHSLISPNFMDCPLLPPLPIGAMGTVISYEVYFDHWDELSRSCNIPTPDIIFDLDDNNIADIEQHDFTVVYYQIGDVSSCSSLFPGGEVSAGQFLAVRNDYLSILGDIQPSRLQFEDIQCSS